MLMTMVMDGHTATMEMPMTFMSMSGSASMTAGSVSPSSSGVAVMGTSSGSFFAGLALLAAGFVV